MVELEAQGRRPKGGGPGVAVQGWQSKGGSSRAAQPKGGSSAVEVVAGRGAEQGGGCTGSSPLRPYELGGRHGAHSTYPIHSELGGSRRGWAVRGRVAVSVAQGRRHSLIPFTECRSRCRCAAYMEAEDKA